MSDPPNLDEHDAIASPADKEWSEEDSVKKAALEGVEAELEAREENTPLDIIDREDFSLSEDTSIEDEKVFYVDKTLHICSAYPGPENLEKGWQSGLKGHEHRNLAVYHETGVVPPSDEFYADEVDKSAAELLRDITASQIEDGYLVVFGSMASVGNQFHVVGSTLRNYGISDFEDHGSYFLYEVEDGEIEELVEAKIEDFFGVYIQQMLNEDSEEIEFDMFEYESYNLEEIEMSSREYAEALVD